MKQFQIILAALFLSTCLQAEAIQGTETPAKDKVMLGEKVAKLLDKAVQEGCADGLELEMILEVGEDGKIQVLDMEGEREFNLIALRQRIENAGIQVDASMEGRAFRLFFPSNHPNS